MREIHDEDHCARCDHEAIYHYRHPAYGAMNHCHWPILRSGEAVHSQCACLDFVPR